MKRTIKKIVAMTLAAGMLLSMSGFSALAAGNYEDSYFYNFTITGTTKYTTSRPKLDDTSASVKLSKAATPVVVRVYGSKTQSGIKYDRTYGTPKVVGVSPYYTYLLNSVKENGDSWACLGFTRSSVSNVTISGAWSPDSI
ncbi:hypothetical protein C808_01423 [Lachnospiraceae bacterium M18-1]|nr:hypothetical protein C808_01423 [Lachnospiraceae bacterium M18-1]